MKEPAGFFSYVSGHEVHCLSLLIDVTTCTEVEWEDICVCVCVFVSVCVMGVCKCVSHMRGNEIFIIGRLSSHGADWVQITRSGDKKKNTKWLGC